MGASSSDWSSFIFELIRFASRSATGSSSLSSPLFPFFFPLSFFCTGAGFDAMGASSSDWSPFIFELIKFASWSASGSSSLSSPLFPFFLPASFFLSFLSFLSAVFDVTGASSPAASVLSLFRWASWSARGSSSLSSPPLFPFFRPAFGGISELSASL